MWAERDRVEGQLLGAQSGPMPPAPHGKGARKKGGQRDMDWSGTYRSPTVRPL